MNGKKTSFTTEILHKLFGINLIRNMSEPILRKPKHLIVDIK